MHPGHGFYLLASNGGTFSSHDLLSNNVIKAFKFDIGDEIVCKYSPYDKNVSFWKLNDPENIFTMTLMSGDGVRFSPCVAFYFPGTEVEFISEVKNAE
jgi:hypothetical protein